MDQEAAVADLAKGDFCDKVLINKKLFEIDEGEQNGQKWGKKAVKHGEKKNFHFGEFLLSNLQKLGQLRQRRAQGRRGLWSERGGEAVREGCALAVHALRRA